jgi:diketogulonate reductase-like aldo/keto reductase
MILHNDIRMTRLSNIQMMPLIGFGAGNVPRSHVGALVADAIQPDKKIYLIDTARESKNEALIAEGIVAGAERFNTEDVKPEIHVITKVWYTHLGYNRTKLAVEDSLEAFRDALESDKVDVKLHIQLHYPRCYKSIEWMDCDNEEAVLDEKVKQVGPDPRLDPRNSLKGSWTYLEDLYLSANFPVASIGVSNFALADLEEVQEYARVQPHTLQINMWSVLYDPLLVEHCRRHNIHLQVYNALQSTMSSLEYVAKAVPSPTMTPGQAVISWLVKQGISVFPRTSKMTRLSENSATAIASMPSFSPKQMEDIEFALRRGFGEDDIIEELPIPPSADVVSWFLAITSLIVIVVTIRAPSVSSPPKPLKATPKTGRRKRLKPKHRSREVFKERAKAPVHVGRSQWLVSYLLKQMRLSKIHSGQEKIE